MTPLLGVLLHMGVARNVCFYHLSKYAQCKGLSCTQAFSNLVSDCINHDLALDNMWLQASGLLHP